MTNEAVADTEETVIVADRETLHALVRLTAPLGMEGAGGSYATNVNVIDLAVQIANATAAVGSRVMIRAVD